MMKVKRKNISSSLLIVLSIFSFQLAQSGGQVAFLAREVRFNFKPDLKESDDVILIIEGAQTRIWRNLIIKTKEKSIRVKNQDDLMQLSKFDPMSARMYIYSVDEAGKVKDLSSFHISFTTKDKKKLVRLMIEDGSLVSLKFMDM